MAHKRKASLEAASKAASIRIPLSNAPKTLTRRDAHFRQLYAQPPDFAQLSRLDPAFAAVAQGRELDFHDPNSVKQLTKTLLKVDFAIDVELPDDRLCPPVPNRHNYILWLKDLMDTTSYDEPGRRLTGLDIGTGASCIYPLLGCAQRPWSFIATDVDIESLAWAAKNVARNDLTGRIKLIQRSPDDTLVPADQDIDFTMTNPPFYASQQDLEARAQQKKMPPNSACTGTPTEMVTPGGEASFVDRLLQESLVLKTRVQWYTAMFGFLASLTDFIDKLKAAQIHNYAVTEFVQGTKTRRWAVAWSFGSMRPAQHVARGTRSALSKSILPPSTEAAVMEFDARDAGAIAARVSEKVGTLHLMSWQWNKQTLDGIGRAADKVWARAWRRKVKRGETTDANETCVFGFQVRIRVTTSEGVLSCRWIEGDDESAFESFRGFLKAAAQPP